MCISGFSIYSAIQYRTVDGQKVYITEARVRGFTKGGINVLEVNLDNCVSSFVWDGDCYRVFQEEAHVCKYIFAPIKLG